MTGAAALAELERRLIAVRGIAAAEAAWAKYRADVLPADLQPTLEPKMAQAFAAGYDAAMAGVRSVLATTQNSVLGSRYVRGDEQTWNGLFVGGPLDQMRIDAKPDLRRVVYYDEGAYIRQADSADPIVFAWEPS